MFEVFEDMKKGKYVRNTVITNTKRNKLQKIEGPLEMNGTRGLSQCISCLLSMRSHIYHLYSVGCGEVMFLDLSVCLQGEGGVR